MQSKLVVMLVICFSATAIAQNVGINTTGATPDRNAILDLNTGNSGHTGLLIPSVSLNATLTQFSPPMAYTNTAADIGMMVYNTNASAGSGVGYYSWNGTTWVAVTGSASGGVTSVTGTTPVVASPTTGNVVVSLQGSAGTVCYGTGGGSNFTGVGNAPGGTPASASSNYLQSQGTSAPTWVQPVSRYVIPVQREAVASTTANYYFTVPGSTFSSVATANGFVIPAGGLSNFYSEATIPSTGNFSKFIGWASSSAANETITFYVYKYTPVSGSTASITGTLLGSVALPMATATGNYPFEIDAAGAVNKGDIIMVWWSVGANANYYFSGSLEFTTNVQ